MENIYITNRIRSIDSSRSSQTTSNNFKPDVRITSTTTLQLGNCEKFGENMLQTRMTLGRIFDPPYSGPELLQREVRLYNCNRNRIISPKAFTKYTSVGTHVYRTLSAKHGYLTLVSRPWIVPFQIYQDHEVTLKRCT